MPKFQDQVLAVARRVIDRASRDHPADAVLRETLRAERGLDRRDTASVSDAVFTYYRWLGWLDPKLPLPERIQQALELAQVFQAEPNSFPPEELCAKAVPGWVSDEVEITPEWAAVLQNPPGLWIRAKKGQGSDLADTLRDVEPAGPDQLADALRYFGQEDLFRTPEFEAGSFELQDLSSQFVGLICNPQPGQTWWDACAGEGGKTLHLSNLMDGKGLIWASDRSEWRLRKLKIRAARAGMFNYRSVAWDGGSRPPTKTRFDGILVDAPCSGVGTWHRNPHARWTTTITDVRELAVIQTALLEHACGNLKPGGRLIYSVCTLTRSETIEVASQFQAKHPGMIPLPIVDPLHPHASPQANITYRTESCGGNGMFIAAWQKS